MKYNIYLANKQDGRATDSVWLDEDFTWVGEIEASSPKDILNIMATTDANELDLHANRQIAPGDVVLGADGIAQILTPMGVWARVDAYMDEENS